EREITTQAGEKALNWMFEHTDAHRIVGRAALELTQAHGFVKRIGMREIGADAHNRYYEISKEMPAAIPIAGAVIGAVGAKQQSDAAKRARNAASSVPLQIFSLGGLGGS